MERVTEASDNNKYFCGNRAPLSLSPPLPRFHASNEGEHLNTVMKKPMKWRVLRPADCGQTNEEKETEGTITFFLFYFCAKMVIEEAKERKTFVDSYFATITLSPPPLIFLLPPCCASPHSCHALVGWLLVSITFLPAYLVRPLILREGMNE